MSEWISVEERLPEDGKWVTCHGRRQHWREGDYDDGSFRVGIGRYQSGWGMMQDDSLFGSSIYEQSSEVTHWMALPTPPAGPKEEG